MGFFPLIKKCYSFLLISFFFLFIFPTKIFSIGEFTSSYNILYEINNSGITKITQNVSLINLTTDKRAESYIIVLKTPHVENISAYDNKGAIKTQVSKTDKQTKIELKFNDIIVGRNKVLSWTLIYEISDLAVKNGQIWEITLPGIPNEDNLVGYNVALKVPKEFGPPLYFSPPSNNLTWTKEQIGNGGITGAFGKNQIFDFSLKYHLRNKNSYPIITEIALPPETQYQHTIIEKILPEPDNVVIDSDGNWLAQYKLKQNEKVDVDVLGKAVLFISPQYKIYLNNNDQKKYLTPQKFWEVNDPKIKEIAKTLNSPSDIYNYVVNSLTYDFNKINGGPVKRLGAINALNNKDKAICMEFTDLFIALARASGIPARELDGYAYSTNNSLHPLSLEKDVLHAWPEYYDKNENRWIQIDPTWGNTTQGVDYFNKLDLNHLVFVIKGQNSEYPIPAGSYKEKDDKRDINVFLTENYNPINYEIKNNVSIVVPKDIISGIPFDVQLIVKNNSGIQYDFGKIIIKLKDLELLSNDSLILENLPPFAQKKIKMKLKSKSFFKTVNAKIDIVINDKLYTKDILIQPFYWSKIVQLLGGLFAVIFILSFTAIARHLYIQKHRRNNIVYREGEES